MGDCISKEMSRDVCTENYCFDVCSDSENFDTQETKYSLCRSSLSCGDPSVKIDNQHGFEVEQSSTEFSLKQGEVWNFDVVRYKAYGFSLQVDILRNSSLYILSPVKGVISKLAEVHEGGYVNYFFTNSQEYIITVVANGDNSQCSFSVAPIHPQSNSENLILIVIFILLISVCLVIVIGIKRSFQHKVKLYLMYRRLIQIQGWEQLFRGGLIKRIPQSRWVSNNTLDQLQE